MAGIKIGKITLGLCMTNCYFVYKPDVKDEDGKIPVIFIDPADQGGYLYEKLDENGFKVEAIFFTHGHFDHIMGSKEMRNKSGAKIYAPKADKVLLDDAYVNVSAQWAKGYTVDADEYFEDGAEYEIADMKFKVISTPGHTIGSCCFYFEDDKILVSGDTLFDGSVGRTDLPTGSMSKLVHSVREKLFVLPDDVKVYPGHGAATDIGTEKSSNPCV